MLRRDGRRGERVRGQVVPLLVHSCLVPKSDVVYNRIKGDKRRKEDDSENGEQIGNGGEEKQS